MVCPNFHFKYKMYQTPRAQPSLLLSWTWNYGWNSLCYTCFSFMQRILIVFYAGLKFGKLIVYHKSTIIRMVLQMITTISPSTAHESTIFINWPFQILSGSNLNVLYLQFSPFYVVNGVPLCLDCWWDIQDILRRDPGLWETVRSIFFFFTIFNFIFAKHST